MSPKRTKLGRQADTSREHPHNLGLFARLRAYFVAGVLVIAPISITLYIGWLLISVIDQSVQGLLPPRFNPENYLPFSLPGIGVLIMLITVTTIGALTAGLMGRIVIGMGEGILARIPAVRSVYGAIKQIFETVLAKQSEAFREVVLVEYPRRGMWVIAFITGQTEGEVQNLTEDTLVNIFIPTTPNPTSGFLLFVPRSDIQSLDMSVEEGIKMVVSAGIITPPDRRPDEQKQTAVVEARTTEVLDGLNHNEEQLSQTVGSEKGKDEVEQPRRIA